MSNLSTPLLFALGLASASPAWAQSVLHCYGMQTQIGTVARREFKDANGFVEKEIFYTSTERSMKPTCAEGTLREQSTQTYERDALGRALVENHSGYGGWYVWRFSYVGDEKRPSKRTMLLLNNKRTYEIRYVGGRESSHIYFGAGDRVVGINGRIPDDLELAFEWGASMDGWSCGISLGDGDGRTRLPEINLHLRNTSDLQGKARFILSFDTELRNELGILVPIRAGFLATLPPASPTAGRFTLVDPGEAAFEGFELERRYGSVPAGRYTLQVRHPHPKNELMLVSNTITFTVIPSR